MQSPQQPDETPPEGPSSDRPSPDVPSPDGSLPDVPGGDPNRPRIVRSEELLRGEREVLILHGGETYRLRHTRSGKLLLQK